MEPSTCMSEYSCPSCSRSFDTQRGLGVHHVHVHNERLPNRTCDYCEKRFYSDTAKKYCSKKCLLDSDSFVGENNPNYKGGKSEAECRICGEKFEFYPSDKRGHFCPDCVENETWQTPPGLTGSDNPRWREKVSCNCDICGKAIRRTPGQFNGDAVLCSKECHNVWLSEAFSGEGHPNWKGGGSIYYGKGWRKAKLAALDRDEYSCRVCGTSKDELGRNPDVHHIVPVREFAEADDAEIADAHVLDNLISLCVTCHRNADVGNIPEAELRALIPVE